MGVLSVLLLSAVASVQSTQVILDEPQIVGQEAVFSFQSARRGCYVVEERHPHIAELEHAPISIDYCQGLLASGNLNHTDGRHLGWNYLATLVFYTSEPGRMRIPASAVQRASQVSGSHAFRLTSVQSCDGPESRVYDASLRITTDFGNIAGREASFADNLSEMLSTASGLSQEQFSINELRPGSIIVEMSVLPVQSQHGSSISFLEQALTPSLSSQICELAGAANGGCSVTMTSGVASPTLYKRGGGGSEDDADDALDRVGYDLLFVGGLIILGMSLCAFGVLLCKMKMSKSKQTGSEDAAVVCTETKDLEKNAEPTKATEVSDDASTASPQDSSNGASSEEIHSEGTPEQQNDA